MGVGLIFGRGFVRLWVPLGRRRRRKVKVLVWHHAGCSINHRTEAAALRCRNHDQ